MNSKESLIKAYQILGELMNEDCFDFIEVERMSFDERKEYLRFNIEQFLTICGETNLAKVVKRGKTLDETEDNIDKLFENEMLIADIILLMDEDVNEEFKKEI